VLCALPAFAADDCNSRKTAPDGALDLQQVIELGLCRNPQTAAGYMAVETARLNKNAGYAPYLPSIDATASIGKNYRNGEWDNYWQRGASLSANYLIFDFGKRLADLNALSSVWKATGFDNDEFVQNFVYSIVGAYYNMLIADANVSAAVDLKKTAQISKDTADKKFSAGVVAKADVFQADTMLASRTLDLERAKNNREIAKGQLLKLLSFAQNDDINIKDITSSFGSAAESKSIEELLELAQKQRPDLLAATANKDAAWHRRNARFLSNLPRISATGTITRNDVTGDVFGAETLKNNGSIGLRASMPIFAGFANVYGVRAAQENYRAAQERERAAADNAAFDVFSAYQNYKTAKNVLEQTAVLLKSATEQERVTAGMYKVGRATMLQWQVALAELVDAKKQANAARYDLFIKRAALALSIGEIKSEVEQ
jgi:outer membrane protein TolC